MSDTSIRHRLTAILAADAAGYSRLMAADEWAALAALDAARAVFRGEIEAHQGRVIVAPQIDAAESDKVHRRRPESLGAYEHAVSALGKLSGQAICAPM